MAPGPAVAAVAGVVAGVLAGALALALAGCGVQTTTPGPSASHRLVLIQGSRTDAVGAAIARGARSEAARLGYRLGVRGSATDSAGQQISVIDSAIAAKPAAVVIVPPGAARQALAAPLESMRSAGIMVVEVDLDRRLGGEAARQEGVDAVRRAVREVRRLSGGDPRGV